jgi:hypothetical protein
MRYYVTPLRSPRPHDVTCKCNSIGRWYVTYDVTFSLLAPYPTERLDVILHQKCKLRSGVNWQGALKQNGVKHGLDELNFLQYEISNNVKYN